ncbi:hypothetical protein GMORB2_1358 [Geosmithia morbida]|uniref:Uncharacterized protein n=1 Tax=Geosmithia morbida TaxID=1094350 RepID=A0A9P4Z2A7_9HYPO|nr:uncharacterized protein GMORB2_1358 [Geosmithia morbida]KAF4126112.1 hypothetical protein GMORB2_1358 [Geosmithia morbida]
MPGTPTSTTTSLSALSTTAIKDGHRGHFPQAGPPGLDHRGHHHNPSTTSLEAERADRISRLAGLERVSTLRAPPQTPPGGGAATSSVGGAAVSSLSPQTTPTSTGFPPNYPGAQHPATPAYFDSNGQPVAVTKMSTVGTASATASATESHTGEEVDDDRTTAGDVDEDVLSTDTNYRDAGSVTSTGADQDAMNEDMDRMGPGADDDHMSDGSASLVGFGEGAGSTVSGPIYHRRSTLGSASAAQQMWGGLERTNSGLSDTRRERDRDAGGSDTPIMSAAAAAAAMQERRDARMMDGVSADQARPYSPGTQQDSFVDTTSRGPVPVSSPGSVS